MPDQPNNIVQIFIVGVIAMSAGALDYVHRLVKRQQQWSWVSLVLHLVLAVFSGFIASVMVREIGYSDGFAGACAGAAGWMNVRVFQLIEFKISKQGGG